MESGAEARFIVVLPIPRKRRRKEVDYRAILDGSRRSRGRNSHIESWTDSEPESGSDNFSDLGSPGLEEQQDVQFNPFGDEAFLNDDLIPLPRPPLTADQKCQARMAENVQMDINSGLDFLDDFSEGIISYTNLQDQRLSWSAEQKSILVTLVARKGIRALPAIAARTGKSLIECQAYLDLLNAGCNSSVQIIDKKCIPAAIEVPEEDLESSIGSDNEDFVGYCESNEDGLINLSYILKNCRQIWPYSSTRCLKIAANSVVRFYVKRLLQTIIRTSRRRKDQRRWTVREEDVIAAIDKTGNPDTFHNLAEVLSDSDLELITDSNVDTGSDSSMLSELNESDLENFQGDQN